MRIIHTSDWHLGHVLYGYDRSREQRDMLVRIEEIVGKEKPDALVVSGDVYHTGQPSAAVQKMFTEAVMRLHEACPEMEIVITAGNHDKARGLTNIMGDPESEYDRFRGQGQSGQADR